MSQCLYCNIEFRRNRGGGNKHDAHKYCSKECAFNHKKEQALIRKASTQSKKKYKNCIVCNSSVEVTTLAKLVFCSKDCQRIHQDNKRILYNKNKRAAYISKAEIGLCEICLKEFAKTKHSKKTCSDECSRKLYKIQKNNAFHRRRQLVKTYNDGTLTPLVMKSFRLVEKCYWCSCKIDDSNFSIDHITPLAKGGLHSVDNIVVACRDCNSKKRDLDGYEFANIIGRLC